jgi:hypothetical protein
MKRLSEHEVTVLDLKFDYPCSHGALLHYMIEEDKLVMSNATFYALQCETFDPYLHTDVAAPPKKKRKRTTEFGKRPKRTQVSANEQARPCKWGNNELVVDDRLVPIMKIGGPDEIETFQVPMEFNINAKYDARLHFDVYRTTCPELHSEHGPLRDEDGEVFQDLVRYPMAFVDLPDMSRFFVARKAGRDSFYRVPGLVGLRKTVDTLEVVVTLFDRDFAWTRSQDGVFFHQRLSSVIGLSYSYGTPSLLAFSNSSQRKQGQLRPSSASRKIR